MKYIFDELFDPYRLGFALSFGPWVTMTHFWSTASPVLAAYLVLILWIIARTVWLTFYRRMKKDTNEM